VLVTVVQALDTTMGGVLSGMDELSFEAGGAMGDSGLGKEGGGDLANEGVERWLICESLVYSLPPEDAGPKFSCVCLYLLFCEAV